MSVMKYGFIFKRISIVSLFSDAELSLIIDICLRTLSTINCFFKELICVALKSKNKIMICILL